MRFASLFLLAAVLVSAQHPQTMPELKLTFADDFRGPELNLMRWVPHDPFDARKGQAAVGFSNSAMQLRGAISTIGLFSQLYGHFEIRCRLIEPRARVLVRLLPVHLAELPSIDLFQAGANGPSRVFFGNRWGTEQTERSYGDWFDAPDLSTGMHTLSIDWNKGKIVWTIDAREKFNSVDGVPQQPMFLEIAGESAAGPAVEIASVRIYRLP